MSALVRLYPRAWRDRYETEFRGLLRPGRRPRGSPRHRPRRLRCPPARKVPGSPRLRSPIARTERLAGGASLVAGLGLTAWTSLIVRDFRGWDGEEPATAGLIAALGVISLLALAAAHALLGLAGSGRMRPFGPIAASIAVACFRVSAFGGGATLAYAAAASMALAVAMAGRSIPVWVAIGWIASSVTMITAMLGLSAAMGRTWPSSPPPSPVRPCLDCLDRDRAGSASSEARHRDPGIGRGQAAGRLGREARHVGEVRDPE